MAHVNQKDMTQVSIAGNFRVVYEKKSFLIFTWYSKLKSESVGKDLVIDTLEKYDRIILNGKELTQ